MAPARRAGAQVRGTQRRSPAVLAGSGGGRAARRGRAVPRWGGMVSVTKAAPPPSARFPPSSGSISSARAWRTLAAQTGRAVTDPYVTRGHGSAPSRPGRARPTGTTRAGCARSGSPGAGPARAWPRGGHAGAGGRGDGAPRHRLGDRRRGYSRAHRGGAGETGAGPGPAMTTAGRAAVAPLRPAPAALVGGRSPGPVPRRRAAGVPGLLGIPASACSSFHRSRFRRVPVGTARSAGRASPTHGGALALGRRLGAAAVQGLAPSPPA